MKKYYIVAAVALLLVIRGEVQKLPAFCLSSLILSPSLPSSFNIQLFEYFDRIIIIVIVYVDIYIFSFSSLPSFQPPGHTHTDLYDIK